MGSFLYNPQSDLRTEIIRDVTSVTTTIPAGFTKFNILFVCGIMKANSFVFNFQKNGVTIYTKTVSTPAALQFTGLTFNFITLGLLDATQQATGNVLLLTESDGLGRVDVANEILNADFTAGDSITFTSDTTLPYRRIIIWGCK